MNAEAVFGAVFIATVSAKLTFELASAIECECGIDIYPGNRIAACASVIGAAGAGYLAAREYMEQHKERKKATLAELAGNGVPCAIIGASAGFIVSMVWPVVVPAVAICFVSSNVRIKNPYYATK
jgi:hypothetical protein